MASSTTTATASTSATHISCGLDLLAMVADMLSQKESSTLQIPGHGKACTIPAPLGWSDTNRTQTSPNKAQNKGGITITLGPTNSDKENARAGRAQVDIDVTAAATPIATSSANVRTSHARAIPPSDRVLRPRTKRPHDDDSTAALLPTPAQKRRITIRLPKRAVAIVPAEEDEGEEEVINEESEVEEDSDDGGSVYEEDEDELDDEYEDGPRFLPGTKLQKRRPVGQKRHLICRICGGPIYGRDSDMERHILTHINVNRSMRPHACEMPDCFHRSNQPKNVEKHTKTVHKTKEQACPVRWVDAEGRDLRSCKFTCRVKSTMTRHESEIHVES